MRRIMMKKSSGRRNTGENSRGRIVTKEQWEKSFDRICGYRIKREECW